jgi:hypothetical protein
MRFIDHLRQHPICFNGSTDKFDFDASPLIEGTTVLQVGEVADQLIETITQVTGEGTATKFTDKGKEWLKLRPSAHGHELATDQYVGIIPPFENCFFEYPVTAYGDKAVDCGVHLFSMPRDWIEETFPGQGFAFVMYATVFYRFILSGQSVSGRETTAMFASDSEGQLLHLQAMACLPQGVDRSLIQNSPQYTPLLVLLVSLMMLNCKLLKSTLSPEIVKSRQQRRYEQRHPSRATPPLARYYILSIDSDRTHGDGSSRNGGWDVAWHKVRGFLRHLKSGKVVPVRPHTRGNPLKGVVLKDYEVRGNVA